MNGDIKMFDDSGSKRKSRKTADLISDLEERGYDKENKVDNENKHEDEDEDEKASKNSGYDYLMRLQFRSITEEKINKLTNDIASNEKAKNKLLGMTENQLWLDDLNEFEKAYHKWLKVIEKEIVKTRKK